MIGSIVVTIMVYANVSPLYRGFLAIPNLSLTSAMACRVYRNTKLGLTRESMNMTLSLPTDTSGGTNPQILSVAFARSGQLMDADGTTDSTEIGDLRRGHSNLQAKSQSIGHDYTGGRTEMV